MTDAVARPPWPGYRLHNAGRAMLIYGSGDTLAALILGEFSWLRLLCVLVLAAGFYAWEVPNWFCWIDRQLPLDGRPLRIFLRTGLALAYFNPLWIARHMAVIGLAGGGLPGAALLLTAAKSFLANIPLAVLANTLIQNRLPPSWRFTASAGYSALMAIYYALSRVWFA